MKTTSIARILLIAGLLGICLLSSVCSGQTPQPSSTPSTPRSTSATAPTTDASDSPPDSVGLKNLGISPGHNAPRRGIQPLNERGEPVRALRSPAEPTATPGTIGIITTPTTILESPKKRTGISTFDISLVDLDICSHWRLPGFAEELLPYLAREDYLSMRANLKHGGRFMPQVRRIHDRYDGASTETPASGTEHFGLRCSARGCPRRHLIP